MYIEHTGFKAATDLIAECHATCGKSEPLLARIHGVSGVGKSSVLKSYAARHRPERTSDGTRFQVIYASVPPGPSPVSLTTELLTKMGADEPSYGTYTSQRKRVFELADSLEAEIFLIDEIHHFVDRGKITSHQLAADAFKDLIDGLRKPVVLCGAPRSQRLFDVNTQLRNRFTTKHFIRPFTIESTQEKRALYIGFLKKLCKSFDENTKALYMAHGFADKLFYATDGLPRIILKFTDLMQAAVTAGSSASLETAQVVFQKYIWCDADGAKNPFYPSFLARRLNKLDEPYYPSPIEGDNHA